MIVSNRQQTHTIYCHKSTTNKSFLEMHYYLKSIGIKNNAFMLALLDPDLAGVDPHDKNLSTLMKQKILRECVNNYWYFLREVVRIPDSGSTGGGVKYKLTRGNLALNFAMILNLNIFLELPRQQGKTVSALCRYLWVFNFGTTNSEIAFMNKKMGDSKLNLARLKELRDALPSYLQMSELITPDGKRVKKSNTVESLVHPSNGNKIKTVPSARSKASAASLLRGRTLPLWYADEWAFTPYNEIIYTNTIPAWKTAAVNARKNGAPYGILITTTPGFLTENEGKYAYSMKESATVFTEKWYDMSYQELSEYIGANTGSSFVYIRYSYQQLGASEEWFRSICTDMGNKWSDIRREILLEWSSGVDNSPFEQADLEVVHQLIKQPIKEIMFMNKYLMQIYETVDLRYPPIIGVDVSSGYRRDSSAITCIDSRTTKVFACLNCNYISPFDLASVIHELVTKYMPNAIVNIERNGGFGASVISKLVTTDIKKNLYYEYKEKIIEERQEDNHIYKAKRRVKSYGFDNTENGRKMLMELLLERMQYHKDKFVSPIIYNELTGLEVTKRGKIDHSSNTHDDQIFSMMMALYVWYEGKDLAERYGIKKTSIKTDADIDEEVKFIEGADEYIGDTISEYYDDDESVASEAKKDFNEAKKSQGMTFQEWGAMEEKKQQDAVNQYLSTPLGKKAWCETYNISEESLELKMNSNSTTFLPDSVFNQFYDD